MGLRGVGKGGGRGLGEGFGEGLGRLGGRVEEGLAFHYLKNPINN